jgi:Porin subfamily
MKFNKMRCAAMSAHRLKRTGMGWVRYDSTAAANYCAAYAVAVAGQGVTYGCNPNYSISMLGAVTRWTPVKNLTFSAEAIWTHLTTGFTGTATFSPAAPYPVTALAFKSQDTASLNVRVQRNF